MIWLIWLVVRQPVPTAMTNDGNRNGQQSNLVASISEWATEQPGRLDLCFSL